MMNERDGRAVSDGLEGREGRRGQEGREGQEKRREQEEREGQKERQARLGTVRIHDAVRRFLEWTAAMADERRIRAERCLAPIGPPAGIAPKAEEPGPISLPTFEPAGGSNAMRRLIAAAADRAVRGSRLSAEARSGRGTHGSSGAMQAARTDDPMRSWTADNRSEREEGSLQPPTAELAGSEAAAWHKPSQLVPGTIHAYRGLDGTYANSGPPSAEASAKQAGGLTQQEGRYVFDSQAVAWAERAAWAQQRGEDSAYASYSSASSAAGGFLAPSEVLWPGHSMPELASMQPMHSRELAMPGLYGSAAEPSPLSQLPPFPHAAFPHAAPSFGLYSATGISRTSSFDPLWQQKQMNVSSVSAFDSAPQAMPNMSVQAGLPGLSDHGTQSHFAEEARLRDMLAEIIRADALRHGYQLKER